MIARVEYILGGVKYSFEFDEKGEMDTLHKAIVLANPKTYCNVCKNNDKNKFKLTSNKDTEGNTYVNIKCICGARSKLGSFKSGGFFWREFEVYDPSKKDVEN